VPLARPAAVVILVGVAIGSAVVLAVRVRAALREAAAPAVDAAPPAVAPPGPVPGTRDAQIAADLLAMRDADQRVRDELLGRAPGGGQAHPGHTRHLAADMERLNHEQVVRLAAIIEEIGGWPTYSRFGVLPAHSACVIAVHGLADDAFMARASALMEPLLEAGDADPECWAQVTDRVLVRTGKLQRFGTQMRSDTVDGIARWGIAPVESPETLLHRRAEIGLPDYVAYLARMRDDYRVPDTVPPYPDEPVIPGLIRLDIPESLRPVPQGG
jgi:hypothetical protein